MKRVLVTGGTGFLGRHTVPHLRALGYETIVASSREADLLSGESRRALLDRVRPTHLMHLAWYVEPGKYWTSPENVRWLGASMDLLVEFAARGGRRVVTAGTCAEYSWNSGDGICRELSTPLEPASLYGSAKDALRRIQQALARQLGFSQAWGRLFFPYGPGEPEGRLVPSVIRSVQAGEPARCSDGRQLRDFIYVDDAARALATVMDSDFDGAVNIGTGSGVAVADVARAAAAAAGREDLLELGALPSRPGDPPVLVAATDRLASLGFKPRYSLASGMQLSARALK